MLGPQDNAGLDLDTVSMTIFGHRADREGHETQAPGHDVKGTRQESKGGGRLPKQGNMQCIMKEVEFALEG